MKREPGERWSCEACGEPLVGARTIRGSVAPISVEPKENGNVWLGRGPAPEREVRSAVLGGPLLDKAREAGMSLHENHFATCPEAARFRR